MTKLLIDQIKSPPHVRRALSNLMQKKMQKDWEWMARREDDYREMMWRSSLPTRKAVTLSDLIPSALPHPITFRHRIPMAWTMTREEMDFATQHQALHRDYQNRGALVCDELEPRAPLPVSSRLSALIMGGKR